MPKFFQDVATGRKRFEVRKNDRGFQVGDHLLLREYSNPRYTGRMVLVEVGYMTTFGQQEGWVVMGIERIPRQ